MFDKLVGDVKNLTEFQGMDGNWNFDPYMQGLYNGLEMALATLEKREPKFKSAPDKWLADNGVKRSFPAPEETV